MLMTLLTVAVVQPPIPADLGERVAVLEVGAAGSGGFVPSGSSAGHS